MSQNIYTQTVATTPSGLSIAARQLLEAVRLSSSTVPSQNTNEKVNIEGTADNAYWAYEQLRNAVEYQEQHLLMRSAISRFLMRTFANIQGNTSSLGYDTVRELTKSRYLANGTVDKSTVEQLDARLASYQKLYRGALPSYQKDQQTLLQLIVGVASSDIQHILLPNEAQDALINFTYHSFLTHANPTDKLENADDAIALYAATHTALLRSDMPTMYHYMFQNQFPNWDKSETEIKKTAVSLKQFFGNINTAIQRKRAHAIARMVRSHIAPYAVLHHTLQESANPSELLEQPGKLITVAAGVTEDQYRKASNRLRASIVRAIIFLFVTKMVIALALEVPYEWYFLGELHYVPLAINLVFPPLYMLLIGLTIKTPNARNTEQIMQDLKAVLYQEGTPRYSLGRRIGQGEMGAVFNTVYALCTIAVVIGIGYLLHMLQFSIVSGVIFFIFLSTVSFFGYRISQSVRELIVIEKRNIFDMLWGVVMTPFIRLGQWLSDRYARVNIFMLVLDFVIEAPLKTLLRFYEQWATFLREKQDDVLR